MNGGFSLIIFIHSQARKYFVLTVTILNSLLRFDYVNTGSPDAPQCGFSRTLVGLLREENIEFSHFDILRDEEIRAGLKTFSDWPTYPQLYVKGEFIGGLDIIKEMQKEGNLKSQFGL